MMMCHAASIFLTTRMKSGNAVFMYRDPEVMRDIPEKHISRFKDTDPLCLEQLKVVIS